MGDLSVQLVQFYPEFVSNVLDSLKMLCDLNMILKLFLSLFLRFELNPVL